MSSDNDNTYYDFSREHGVTGNLANEASIKADKKGEKYAKITVFCKRQGNTGDDQKESHTQKSSQDAHSLVIYIRIYNDRLFSGAEDLRQGDFVNFTFEKITFGIGPDKKTDEFRAFAYVIATDFKVLRRKADKSHSSSKEGDVRDENDNDRRYHNDGRRDDRTYHNDGDHDDRDDRNDHNYRDDQERRDDRNYRQDSRSRR